MKAEHRKELQTNVLADRMGRVIQGMKRGPSRSSLVTVVLVLLVAGAVMFFLWRLSRAREREAQRWVEFERLDNPMAYGPKFQMWLQQSGVSNMTHFDLAQLYLLYLRQEQAQTMPGRLAAIDLAWIKLNDEGINKLLVDRDAIENVKLAKKMYEQALPEIKDDPVLAPEARYAIAVAEETLAVNALDKQKALDSAKKLYDAVVADYPKSAHAKDAEKRAKALSDREERQRIERFYDNVSLQRFAQFGHMDRQMTPEQIQNLLRQKGR